MANDFTIEEWEGGRLTETVATATNGIVARAAFRALVELRPMATLMLRHGARVVEKREPGGTGSTQ
jgi:hypothetical protein